MPSLRYAWRNLWRNSRRTVITLAAVALNTTILIASYALMDGLLVHALSNVTNMVVGEVQVHAADYLGERSIYAAVEQPEAVIAAARAAGAEAAARSYGYGLLSSGAKSAGAMMWGVDPSEERRAFDLHRHLLEGEYLGPTAERRIVLGKKLARSLEAEVGDEIVIVVQAADGSLGNDLYTVAGILQAAGETLDRSAAMIHAGDFRRLFVSGDRIHEIALNSRGRVPADELAAAAAAPAPANAVATWREILPIMADMVRLFDVMIWLFGGIFFLAAGLGVLNTMLMATYERTREFGVLKALGATPGRIVRDVAAEAFVLGLTATAIGTAAGGLASWLLAVRGIDTRAFSSGISFAGVAVDPVWRASISLHIFSVPVLAMWAVCVLAALYPAAMAARLDPVRALGHT